MLERLFRSSGKPGVTTTKKLQQLCRRLLSEAGTANSAAIAEQLIRAYSELQADGRQAFFEFLDTDLAVEPKRVLEAAKAYVDDPSPEQLLALQRAAEPPRQELLRRINRAPGGVAVIVAMRRDLLEALKGQPGLRSVDDDFSHLLGSWFNPGFLNLQQVDWNAPAALLEKIIQHEAVHEIRDWGDLRRRLQPDRRCFAFLHPQLPGEPLIFVEVALVNAIPQSIAELIGEGAAAQSSRRFNVAVFYSISNCEPGLRGVSLGNFLIKRVAEKLGAEMPTVKRFCTLSPIPGFRRWLSRLDIHALPAIWPELTRGNVAAAVQSLRDRHGADLEALAAAVRDGALDRKDQAQLVQCAAVFLTRDTTTERGDPVARFHLDNGARLERVNVNANLTPRGLQESFGIMVNYLYDLEAVEANHERFLRGEAVASRQVAAIS